jgi:hypothetical protein
VPRDEAEGRTWSGRLARWVDSKKLMVAVALMAVNWCVGLVVRQGWPLGAELNPLGLFGRPGSSRTRLHGEEQTEGPVRTVRLK